MSKKSDKEHLQSLAAELARDLKTDKDLLSPTRELVRLTVETALGKDNSRNGTSRKTIEGQIGEVEISAPLVIVREHFLQSSSERIRHD